MLARRSHFSSADCYFLRYCGIVDQCFAVDVDALAGRLSLQGAPV